MKDKSKKVAAAQKAFNTINILKGQYTNIATSDSAGNPNVAPIGSMRVVDEKTVHVLQGFLPRTFHNLKQNPKAVFSVCLKQSVFGLITLFRDKEDDVMGYQLYGTLTHISDAPNDVAAETNALASRVPFFLRGPFRKFCDKNLKRLLTFTVDDVREIGVPE